MQEYIEILNKLEKRTIPEIMLVIGDYPRVIRITLEKLAQELNYTNLFIKLNEANERINNRIVDNFKKSVKKGLGISYLEALSLTDKIFLRVDLQLYLGKITPTKKFYADILNQEIEKDMAKLYSENEEMVLK